MVSKEFPKHLWYYDLVHKDGIVSRIACGKRGRTGIKEVTGQTRDISEFLEFDFYDCAWWINKNHLSATDDNIILGKWLGISHKTGSDMC